MPLAMSSLSSATSSCWRPRLEVVCFFKSGRRTPRFFMSAILLRKLRGRMPQDSANSLRVLPARCAERYATINSRAPANTLFERVFVFLVVVSVPVVITSLFIRITLFKLWWKTVVKRTVLFFALVLPYTFNLSIRLDENNRDLRKYTKKVFLVSVSTLPALILRNSKKCFFICFCRKIPRGYGSGICGGDMEQGYGGEIWHRDMERGYACRKQNQPAEKQAGYGKMIWRVINPI
jgi:hypothetical protein